MNKQKILKAGRIAKQVRDWIKPQIKKGKPLLEIAEQIEKKIIELGGKPAFPTNLSIDNVAAHYTPSHDDKTLARGLLKIDFGVHIEGEIADTAFSVDLENSDENKKLIKASEDALRNAIELIKSRSPKARDIDGSVPDISQGTSLKKSVKLIKESSAKNRDKVRFGAMNSEQSEPIKASQIGAIISKTIESKNFSPIINLSGHSMEEYDLHSGVTIPNIDDKREIKLKKGLYAIEPFATTGTGKVHDSKPSGIYSLIDEKNPRSQIARKVLEFIQEEYQTLPFCSRWIIKKFGAKGLIGLRQLEENGNLHQFAQLVESSNAKVSQTEHTILVDDKEVIVTTD